MTRAELDRAKHLLARALLVTSDTIVLEAVRQGVDLVAEVRRLRKQYARFVVSMYMNAGAPPHKDDYAIGHGFESWAEIEEEARSQ